MKVLLGLETHAQALEHLSRALEHVIHADDDVTVVLLHGPDTDDDLSRLRDAVRRELADRGLPVRLRTMPRDPPGALVEVAEREGYDELVLGGGKRSPTGKMRLGRAAEYAVLNARTTVVLVR